MVHDMKNKINRAVLLWLLFNVVILNSVIAYGSDDEWVDFMLDYEEAYYCDNGEFLYFYDDFTAYYSGDPDCDIEWEWGDEAWTIVLYFNYDEGMDEEVFNIEGSEEDGYTFSSSVFNMSQYPPEKSDEYEEINGNEEVPSFEPDENIDVQIRSYGNEKSINIEISFEHLNEFVNTERNSIELLISNASLTYEVEYELDDVDNMLRLSTWDWDSGVRNPQATYEGGVSYDIEGDTMICHIDMTPSGFDYENLKYVSVELTYQDNYGGPIFTFKHENDEYRLLDHLSLYERNMYIPINYSEFYIDH